MSMSREEQSSRNAEIVSFAVLLQLTGSVEKAEEILNVAKDHLYPQPNKSLSKSETNGLLSALIGR